MKFMKLRRVAFCLFTSLCTISCAHNAANIVPPPVVQPTPAAVSFSPADMEKAFKLAGTPGPEHAALKNLVGTWKAQVKWWMDPTGKPQISTGTSINHAILDGKFIKEDYSGKMMGRPFAGVGFLGYDNVAKTYASTTIGSFGYRRALGITSTKLGEGTLLVAGEVGSYNGPWENPDGARKLNSVVRYSQGTSDNGFSLTGMAYSNKWNSTDQIPLRAITSE